MGIVAILSVPGMPWKRRYSVRIVEIAQTPNIASGQSNVPNVTLRNMSGALMKEAVLRDFTKKDGI